MCGPWRVAGGGSLAVIMSSLLLATTFSSVVDRGIMQDLSGCIMSDIAFQIPAILIMLDAGLVLRKYAYNICTV